MAILRPVAPTAPLRVAAGYIQVLQAIPVLMLLFLSYYGLSLAGFDLPPIFAASVSMALYVSAYLGEIWRGSIQAVPWQQWEASTALACSRRSNTATSSCRRRSASRCRRPSASWSSS